MSERDQNRKLANETIEKAKAVAEQSAQAVESIRDLNVKMIDIARAHTEAVFEFARQLATATTPSDLIELWTSHGRKQFEILSEQSKELTAIGQKIAGQSAEPIARSVSQAFKKVA